MTADLEPEAPHTPEADTPEADTPEATSFSGLGSALRRLRVHQGLKQYEMADAAGITKAMLSAYETGKRRPSLKTLSQLLEALDADLGSLHRAMMAERYGDSMLATRRARRAGYPSEGAAPGSRLLPSSARDPSARDLSRRAPSKRDLSTRDFADRLAAEIAEPPADVYEVLGVDHRLPVAEERALSEMLRGFHNLLRYLHHRRVGGAPGPRRE